jgi:exodeoxyribonuclease VII large subunit
VLEQQRQTTLAQLVANNPTVIRKVGDRYITRNAELPLPKVIQRIAVVSSKTSAGNEDFKHTLLNNPYGYGFAIDDYFTIVQNDAYAQEFLDRLIDVFKSGIAYDAVVINRGGGAQTDFLMFDNYKIGLAVARFPIPIITGIGHQKNETIADLMAHTPTKTPTQAAEFIIAHNKRFEDALLQLQQSILIKTQQLFSVQFQQLSRLNSNIVNCSRTFIADYKDALVGINQIVVNDSKRILYQQKNKLSFVASTLIAKPRVITGNKQNDLNNLLYNIMSYQKSYIKNKRGYLQHYVSVINMMSPANILKKGFAIVKIDGEVTSNADKLLPGSNFDVILSNQTIHSTVESKTPYHGKDFNL